MRSILKRHILKAILLVTLAALLSPAGSRAASPQQERDECAKNLQTINKAIQAYRRDKKDVPLWLSDLVPDYLDDPNLLICPVTRRTGEMKNQEYSDPRISTSYIYEFNDKEAPGGGGSNRQWKRLQMSVVGSIVPVVRCWNHEPILNLSFDGKIFESNIAWEDQLNEFVDPAELTAARLFTRFNPMENFGTFHTIDLTPFYNCKLDEPIHNEPTGRGPSFKHFPAGTNVFGGISFATAGVIQLNGNGLQRQQPGRYTNQITGISIGMKVRRLHFLGGVGWTINDNTEIGTIVVHYENQSQDRVAILYNRQVRDWWQGGPGGGGANDPKVAWSGDIDKDNGGTGPGNVYRYAWMNPQPDVPITSIDIRSTMLEPAPFFLAVTAETR